MILATAGAHLAKLPGSVTRLSFTSCPFAPGDRACVGGFGDLFNGGSLGPASLAPGKPVLGLPSNLDQFLNMHFIEAAGLGRVLRESDGVPTVAAVESFWEDEGCLAGDGVRRPRPSIDPDPCSPSPPEGALAGNAAPAAKRFVGGAAGPALGPGSVDAAVTAPRWATSQPWRYSLGRRRHRRSRSTGLR